MSASIMVPILRKKLNGADVRIDSGTKKSFVPIFMPRKVVNNKVLRKS